MSIYYRVVKRVDPRNPQGARKYYAGGASVGCTTLNDLATRVARRSGHSAGTVSGILYDLCEAIVHFIGQGRNVDLGNFGIIQLRLRNTSGSVTKEEFRVSQVEEKKLHFVPGFTVTSQIAGATLTDAGTLYNSLAGTPPDTGTDGDGTLLPE